MLKHLRFTYIPCAILMPRCGLLRWAISKPEPLIRLIQSEGENLYLFENLSPSAPRMVRDAATGIAFHTKMFSENGKFLDDDATRRKIWENEREKIGYLKQKLFEDIRSGSKVFVYKCSDLASEGDALKLAQALREKGKAPLIWVRLEDDRPVGEVRHHADNLYFGSVDRFAHYSQASNVSIEAWQALLHNADALIGR